MCMKRNELDRMTEDRNLWWSEFWDNLKWIIKALIVIGILVAIKFLQINSEQ